MFRWQTRKDTRIPKAVSDYSGESVNCDRGDGCGLRRLGRQGTVNRQQDPWLSSNTNFSGFRLIITSNLYNVPIKIIFYELFKKITKN